jgi:hypothetical protein
MHARQALEPPPTNKLERIDMTSAVKRKLHAEVPPPLRVKVEPSVPETLLVGGAAPASVHTARPSTSMKVWGAACFSDLQLCDLLSVFCDVLHAPC